MPSDDVSRKTPEAAQILRDPGASHRREPVPFTLKRATPSKELTDLLVVGVFSDGALSPAAKDVDDASKGRLSALSIQTELDAQAGTSLMLYDVPGIVARR